MIDIDFDDSLDISKDQEQKIDLKYFEFAGKDWYNIGDLIILFELIKQMNNE